MTCIFKNFKPFHDMTNILAFINPESECDNVDEYVTGLDGSLYPLMGVQMGNWRQHWIQMNMEEAWTCVASTPNILAKNTDMLMLAEPIAHAISPTPSLR